MEDLLEEVEHQAHGAQMIIAPAVAMIVAAQTQEDLTALAAIKIINFLNYIYYDTDNWRKKSEGRI